MASSKKAFDFAEGVYYFNIRKGYNNKITIKRIKKDKAIHDFHNYQKTHKDQAEWLGKWDGKNFVDDNFQKLLSKVSSN